MSDEEQYTERQIYRDAWNISEPGASNPVAVARTLAKASSALLHSIGTDGVRKHPALRVIAGQLTMLYDVNSLGAELDDYDRVKSYYDKTERGYVDICTSCGAYNDFPCVEGKMNRLVDHPGRPHTMDRDFTEYGERHV